MLEVETIVANIICVELLMLSIGSYKVNKFVLDTEQAIKNCYNKLSKKQEKALTYLVPIGILSLIYSELFFNFLRMMEHSPFKFVAIPMPFLLLYRCIGATVDEMKTGVFYSIGFIILTTVLMLILIVMK